MPEVRAADTERLIAAIAEGEEAAMEDLYARTSPYVFGLLLRILGSRSEAEEVAQEVYVQVWRTADEFDAERGSGLAWIGMIARSRALDLARSRGSYGRAIERLERQPASQPLGEPAEDPTAGAVTSERRALVLKALEELPAEQRATLELAFFDGRSHRQIAESTGLPLGTVKSRIRAAIGKLEAALEPVLGGRGISGGGAA